MSWIIAVPLFWISWFVFVVLGAVPKALDYERNGVPDDERYGVSIVPGIPVFPMLIWIVWGISSPVIADMIVWLHIVLLGFSVVIIGYYTVRLRRLRSKRERSAESVNSAAD